MDAWLETAMAILTVGAGAVAGWWFSRQTARWWIVGYALPLAFMVSATAGFYLSDLLGFPPFTWALEGRSGYATYGLATVMVLQSLVGRLPQRRERLAVQALCLVAGMAALCPFVVRAVDQPHLARLQSRVDGEGVCHQTTSYTCGPAAAVTWLRRLGFPAEEGRMAIAAKTSSFDGTPPVSLARAVERLYRTQGLRARARSFRDFAELKSAGPTLAIMKLSLLIDHYVAVLEVGDDFVVVGDPLRGRERLSRQDFEDRWRFAGVEMTPGGRGAKD